MRRYLLGTGIAGDYINRRHGVHERARAEVQRGNRIGIAMPVLCELWHGVEHSASRDRNVGVLQRALATLAIWPLTEGAAREYGRLAATLQRVGRVVQQHDLQIAAVALSLGNCTVVSADSDMIAIPGLTVENWAT